MENKGQIDDLSVSPVVKTPCFHCREHWFSPA